MNLRRKIPTKVSWKTVGIIAILCILLTSAVFVFAQTPTTTFTISPGMYPGATDFSFWKEGSYYYMKDQYGEITSNTNYTALWEDAIDNLPTATVMLPDASATDVSAPYGTLLLKGGEYQISSTLQVPLGARIIILGEGTTQQMVGNGENGATQIINSGDSSAFEMLATRGGTTTTGSVLILKHIEFVQQVALASDSMSCVNLDGMAQGILENVQAIRNYTKETPITGTGIKCDNYVGADHAGGDTLWKQVQVCGFNIGVNATIDHWECLQLDIANCTTGLILYNNLANQIRGLHIFQCNRILAVYGGFTTYGQVYIEGLYLEECGGGVGGYEWYVDSTFHSYIRIFKTQVNVVSSAGTLWRCNDNESLWFTDVMVTGGAPAFPSVVEPSWVDNTNHTNSNMEMVEVTVSWGDIVGLWVNNEQLVNNVDNRLAVYYLRPGDYIRIDMNAGSPTWIWRSFSADRGRQDDL